MVRAKNPLLEGVGEGFSEKEVKVEELDMDFQTKGTPDLVG